MLVIKARDTAIMAGLVLGEVNALAIALGLSMVLNTAGEFIATGDFNSDTGEFSESVSSTEGYCTVIDTDYAVVTTSLTSPIIQSNYATVGASLSSPFIDCTGALHMI